MKDEYARLMGCSQLFRPTPASLEALETAASGTRQSQYPEEQLLAVGAAQNRLRHFLRARYLPPPGTPFVPFASEEGTFDVVRAKYAVGSYRIDLAETLCLVSITVSLPMAESVPCLERVTQLAHEMLPTKSPVQLVQVGQKDNMSFGKQRREQSKQYPSWEDALRWWCTATQVGFLTLATLGAPEPLVYSFNPESNRVWFHKRTTPPRPQQW